MIKRKSPSGHDNDFGDPEAFGPPVCVSTDVSMQYENRKHIRSLGMEFYAETCGGGHGLLAISCGILMVVDCLLSFDTTCRTSHNQ